MSIRILSLLAFVGMMVSCSINRNIMFKTDQEYVYDPIPLDSAGKEYTLAPNDMITFQLFTNQGAMILDFTTNVEATRTQALNFRDFVYLIDSEGYLELPSIGRVKVSGMTVFEAQTYLEGLYEQHFNYPYALLQVINRRVIVFRGSGADASVIPMTNNNINVIEVLALAGGLSDRANASKVKLIRKVKGKQEVYLMDLSTIEGIKYASMIVQAGDIIYVEPTPEIASEVMKDVAPYVTIVSGLAFIWAIFSGGI
jgi:polysaccharide biosynthesis/export protein